MDSTFCFSSKVFGNFSILLLTSPETSKVRAAERLIQSRLQLRPSALNTGAAFSSLPRCAVANLLNSRTGKGEDFKL